MLIVTEHGHLPVQQAESLIKPIRGDGPRHWRCVDRLMYSAVRTAANPHHVLFREQNSALYRRPDVARRNSGQKRWQQGGHLVHPAGANPESSCGHAVPAAGLAELGYMTGANPLYSRSKRPAFSHIRGDAAELERTDPEPEHSTARVTVRLPMSAQADRASVRNGPYPNAPRRGLALERWRFDPTVPIS